MCKRPWTIALALGCVGSAGLAQATRPSQVTRPATQPLNAPARVFDAPARQLEKLDRGVVAVARPDGAVVVSWRLLGNEPADVRFHVVRKTAAGETTLNAQPLAGPTFFVDEQPMPGATYIVRAISGDAAVGDRSFTLAADGAHPYLTLPLQTPVGYVPGDCSTGDLDGDGRLELVVKFEGRAKDNSQAGVTDPVQLHAYALDGTRLWAIDLGPNVRGGAHYTQFQVADYDGDGRAELICKTADATVDGAGKPIGDASARYANESGHVLRGPEFLTVFDGRTGAALDTIPYQPGRAGPGVDGTAATPDQMKAIWGDGYGNRGDRYLAATAWLDGRRPTAVMCRGYYTRSFLWAVDFDGKRLVPRWLFDSENPDCTRGRDQPTADASGRHPFSGQGFHSLSVADVDGDGRDEIAYGAMTVDDDGRGLYTTGWGHGDALHVGDLDPSNPGLEVFGIQERFDDAGAHLHDARTGRPLWRKPSVKAADSGGDKGEGPGRGVCFDVDPRHPGSESWTAGAGLEGIWNAAGEPIGTVKPPSCNFRIYWDGDLQDELLNRNAIEKWLPEQQKTQRLLTAEGCESNNGTKATPALSCDLIGDWREELVLRTSDNQALRIYTTTIPTEHRRPTLMHDPQYRASIAWQNTAYNQPPHVGFDMSRPHPAPGPQLNVVPLPTPAR